MRKHRNDSLINEHKSMNIEKNNLHNNTSAGTVLQAIKGGKDGRPAVELLVANRRRSLTSDVSRTGVHVPFRCSLYGPTLGAIVLF